MIFQYQIVSLVRLHRFAIFYPLFCFSKAILQVFLLWLGVLLLLVSTVGNATAAKVISSNSGQSNSDSEITSEINSTASESSNNSEPSGVISDRAKAERQDAFNPYVITAHKHNYVLPLSYTTNVNKSAFELQDAPDNLTYKPYEVSFQISLKSQINNKPLFATGDALFFGLTIESWWQLYNAPLSSPFRETNYQPEIFYVTPLVWGPFGGKTAFVLGLEHQSNGQLQALSRSWNRVYSELIYERGSFVASLRPWYRLPEKAKRSPQDAEGDDNPDILDYLGHGQLSFGWKKRVLEFSSVLRGNTTTGKGSLESTLTFPLFGRFRGMAQYFNGYGDSLIDYNRFQQRFAFGVALTNLF